jgi:hypothetical protein
MRIETGEQVKFNSIPFKVETPSGTMYVFVMENSKGDPVGIQLVLGKAGSELSAWAHGLARLASLILDLRGNITDLIAELSNHTSDRSVDRKNGVRIRSGIDGLVYALMEYQRERYRQQTEFLDIRARLGG